MGETANMSAIFGENVAMDTFLQQLVENKQFELLSNKNWDAMSHMFPGTTPYQCQKRYKELKLEAASTPVYNLQKLTPSNKAPTAQKGKSSIVKDEKSAVKERNDTKSTPNSANSNSSERDQGPTMVIHVCDEAKNLKQDFTCPRDLLVKEMKYFAEYLSADSQRWEDVDISVHCDVQIFDWLMKYVKRGTKEVPNDPKLETTNVISILISSDFLKMDNLIERCIIYCHKHMNAILATPCNMNCINDRLVTRMADLFSHNEIEELRDRKDKFRSKLFAKKVEKLFELESSKNNPDSPESACTLYKCKACEKLLTKTLERRLDCITSRMLVNKQGELVYVHERDTSWDINDYLVELKQELKTWRDVYWRLWGLVNFLECTSCTKTFQCCELAGCLYHKERAVFQADVLLGKFSGAVGTYLCCGDRVMRFDPTEDSKGCEVKDHIVRLVELGDGQTAPNKVYDDLLAYRQAIAVEVIPPKQSTQPLNVFANDEFVSGLREDGIGMKKPQNVLKQPTKSTERRRRRRKFQQPKLQALTHEVFEDESLSDRSDDELGDEEVVKVKPLRQKKTQVTVKSAAILVDGPEFAGHHRNKWDISRSVRFNQDAQRQEDIIRLRDMVTYLTKLRMGADKMERHRQKEYAGGIYAKLDAQFRANLAQANPNGKGLPAPRSSRGKMGNVKSTF